MGFGHPSERSDIYHTTGFERAVFRFDEMFWTRVQDLAVPRYGHRFAFYTCFLWYKFCKIHLI